MQEPNETTQNPQHKQEICTIRIVFPVTSDEHAFEYKKKISGILSEIPDVQIQFSISSMMPGMPSSLRQ